MSIDAVPVLLGADVPLVSFSGLRDAAGLLAMLVGLFFMFVGTVGVYRLPDSYSRMHAVSKCTTLGLTGLLLAAVLHIWTLDTAGKGLMVVVFTFVATPIGTHLLAKAAHHGGALQDHRTLSDELAQDKADPGMAVNDDQIGVVEPEDLRGSPGHIPPARELQPTPSGRSIARRGNERYHEEPHAKAG